MSKECVGCGWCCLTDQCDLSMRLYGYQKRCPAIHFDEERKRYVCKLVGDPKHDEEARRALFVGQGCCNPLGDWRDDVRNRDEDFPAK